MGKIIVTIKDERMGRFVDTEIPTDQPLETLKYDIAEAVNQANAGIEIDPDANGICCKRLNRMLENHETMESAGIWNGDVLCFQPGIYY